MPERILAIDDEEHLLKLIDKVLTKAGYTVVTASNGEEGVKLFHQTAPDLVVLDIMMPGMDGREVCRRLRQTSSVPIVFLTALDSEKNIVDGLMGGADDYLTKPIRINELRARVADLIINRAEQTVFAYGNEVQLSPIEYNLLLFMAERAGHILPTETLYNTIWGSSADAGSQGVKWYIWRLRQKIEDDPQEPRFILTERGKGYRFSPR
jgi:two-component system KDP operon response regulator KdpE